MSGAVNQLVSSYLAEVHPKVARVLVTEALLSKKECKRAFQTQSIADVLQSHLGHAEPRTHKRKHTECEVQSKQTESSSRNRTGKGDRAGTESSDDEAMQPRAVAVAPSFAEKHTTTTLAEHGYDKKAAHALSGVYNTNSKTNNRCAEIATRSAIKKAKVDEECKSNNEDGSRPSAPKRRDSDEYDNGAYKRFQRIDPTKVTFHADELRDNRPGQEHLSLRQNQEMMRVKGKNFNKLKQKNKGKFYGAGVDLTVRAYQFPDSDNDE